MTGVVVDIILATVQDSLGQGVPSFEITGSGPNTKIVGSEGKRYNSPV